MWFICGLGNPGKEYECNRHNIGFMLLDYLHDQFRGTSWKSKSKGEFSDIQIDGNKVYLLKPLTYMNLSGESLKPFASFFKIPLENILIDS